MVWGIPFGFLVMLSVWNRYDPRVEEAARDLGADQSRTFREVTLPLVWTGIFGCFLFGFTLTWNDYDRSVLFQTRATDSLPLEIGGITFTGGVRPDLYALGTATTLFSLLVIAVLLVVASLRLRFRGDPGATGRGGARRRRGDRRRGDRNRGGCRPPRSSSADRSSDARMRRQRERVARVLRRADRDLDVGVHAARAAIRDAQTLDALAPSDREQIAALSCLPPRARCACVRARLAT